ncbi:aspartate/glutamate racemase family protein [Svornostia abyssi]|uniref:Aspartate/glutamate racemase family protein n=1 Tax=Svornostia abyssi TaxID=2898438 RepID=A0ABY5PIK0_9ACTN|nr:aspartate/glutamate racemase family protein [Parviterribacteraceae bacterium J379]
MSPVFEARPGQDTHGGALGILHVPVSFPLIPGTAGNAASYPYPVVWKTVAGVSVDEIVRGGHEAVAARLIDAAVALERDGVRAIAGDCGTLLRFQADVAAAVSVPVLLSPLLAVPLVSVLTGGRPVGVLAANAANIREEECVQAGIRPEHGMVVEGLETRDAWRAAIVDEAPSFDSDELERDVVGGALALVERAPGIGAIVLDCADLPPYGPAVQRATGLPVFDALTLADLAHAATHRAAFVRSLDSDA